MEDHGKKILYLKKVTEFTKSDIEINSRLCYHSHRKTLYFSTGSMS